MIQSGAVVEDSTIAGMIQNHGNIYTIPFYNTLEGEDLNYDGQTDITVEEVGGGSQTGVCLLYTSWQIIWIWPRRNRGPR